MGKDERGIVLSSGQKDRTLQNGKTEIHGLAVFHELLEQPQDLFGDWWNPTSCKAAKILRSGCRRTLRFIILVGNVSSVIDNFKIVAFYSGADNGSAVAFHLCTFGALFLHFYFTINSTHFPLFLEKCFYKHGRYF